MDINSILGHADEKYNKKYIEEVNSISKTGYRVFVTEKYPTFSKEIKKLHEPDDKTKRTDKKVKENLLGMGF